MKIRSARTWTRPPLQGNTGVRNVARPTKTEAGVGKVHRLAAVEKGANLFQDRNPLRLQRHDHPPMIPDAGLHAHVSLDLRAPFGFMCRWTRLFAPVFMLDGILADMARQQRRIWAIRPDSAGNFRPQGSESISSRLGGIRSAGETFRANADALAT